MSRSRKKPVITDYSRFTTKKSKREASKKVRRTPIDKPIPNGSYYKKLYCSYNIHDWKFYMLKSDIKDYWDKNLFEKIQRK